MGFLGSIARYVFGSIGLEVVRRHTHRGFSLEADLIHIIRNRNGVILDVGANIGQFSSDLVRWFPSRSIIAFEPVPGTYRQLQANFADNPRVRTVCAALGESSRTAHMQIAERSVWNRVAQNDTGMEIDMKSVDDYCRTESISNIALLKTDCEGYDANVIKGAELMLREKRIDTVYSEVNFSRDGKYGDFFAIHECLLPQFVLYGLYDYSPRNHPEFCNALWVRRDLII